MAIQPDARIVVAGTGTSNTGSIMVFARYNSNGTLDETFAGGIVSISFDASSEAKAVAVQPDGKIVAAGKVGPLPGPLNTNFALVRLNSNGTLDLGFNDDGRIDTDFTAEDAAAAIAIQPNDGRIVVAGSAEPTNNGSKRFAVARYHAFVCNGVDVTILGTNGDDTLLGRTFSLSLSSPRPLHAADVIHGLGGSDIIDGLGNDDVICGGEGNDTIRGGPGDDTLFAERGRDSMDGGAGTDICASSAFGDTFDTFIGCETESRGFSGFSGEWLEVSQKCNRSKHHPSCTLHGSLRVFNPGTEPTPVRSAVAFYLSEDERLDANDTFLTTKRIRRLAASGGERVIELDVKLRGEHDLSSLFVIAVLDPFDTVSEVNEENNVVVSPPVSKHRFAGGPGKKR